LEKQQFFGEHWAIIINSAYFLRHHQALKGKFFFKVFAAKKAMEVCLY